MIKEKIKIKKYKCYCGEARPTTSGRLCMNCGGNLK